MRRRLPVSCTLALLALLAAACGDLGASSGAADEAAGDWILVAGSDAEGDLPDVPDAEVTLQIDGEEWGGRAACNSYGGQVRITRNGGVEVQDGFFATEMACEPNEIMELERRYLDALLRVDSIAVDRAPDEADQVHTLTLRGDDIRLRFHAQAPEEPAALVDTRWMLDGLSSGAEPDDAVSSPPLTEQPVDLVLDGRGTFEAHGFCDRYAGTWEHDRNEADGEPTLLLSLRDQIAGECPEESSDDEEHLRAVLFSDATTTRVDGQVLALRAPDGRGLTFRAAQEAEDATA